MAKREGSIYSASIIRFSDETLEKAKRLIEEGHVPSFSFSPGVRSAKGKVEEGGVTYLCSVSFSYYGGGISYSFCSCGEDGKKKCAHIAALCLKTIDATGGYAYFGVPGFKTLLKDMKDGYLKIDEYFSCAISNLRRKREQEPLSLSDSIACLEAIYLGYRSGARFGKMKTEKLVFPALESLFEDEAEMKEAMKVTLNELCEPNIRRFALDCLASKKWKETFLSLFASESGRGVLPVLLQVFSPEEAESFFRELPLETVVSLCEETNLPLSTYVDPFVPILVNADKLPCLISLARNEKAKMGPEALIDLAKYFERKEKIYASFDCWKRLLLENNVYNGFALLANFWRRRSDEEKKDLFEDFREDLRGTELELPFEALDGRISADKIERMHLEDILALRPELGTMERYQADLCAKLLNGLPRAKSNQAATKTIWACFEAYPCLASCLEDAELKKFSFSSSASRVHYLSLLKKKGLLESAGIRALEE